MAGSKMGSLKKKLRLKGKTKPGDMISAMNRMNAKRKAKKGGIKSKTLGAKGTSTATKTATKTSTVANPQGNITITGGAGRGATTTVTIAHPLKKK